MHSTTLRLLAIALAIAMNMTNLKAHDDTKALAPQHGGTLVETTDHHAVEMVLSGTSLVFHMSEHGEPLEVTGSKFKAVIQNDAGTRMIELEAEGTTLKTTLDAPLPKGTKIAVTGKDPHGEVIQARFVSP